MSFEAYSVAVRLKLVDMVTPALGIVASGMRKLHGDATAAQESVAALEKRLQSIKGMAVAGGALMGVGIAGLSLFDAPLKAAREYELAFTKFKTLNLGDAVNRQADQFARGANLMGISAKELMTTMSESVGIFGSYAEAQKMAPKIAALNAANSAIFHGKVGGIDEGASRALVKFIDRRGGAKDDASFERNLDLAQKMVTGSGGFIKFRDLDQFSQQGGTAFRGLSDAGILNMALLLQEQGGSRAGTSLMSIYQNLVAGRTPKKTMAMLQEFGLGHLAMQTHATVGGKSLKSLVMTDVKDAGLLQSDPATWMRTVFLPALAGKGITSEAGILKATNDLLSNRTASGQASIMTTQLLQLMRDANLAKNAMGYDATIKAYKDDPNSKFADLTARWEDTLRELGMVVLPDAIKGVEGLTSALKTVVEFSKEFPGLTKGVLLAGAAIAGLATVVGALTLATAGFKALGLALMVSKGASLGATLLAAAGSVGTFGLAVAGIATVAATVYAGYELYKAKMREGVVLSADTATRLRDPAVQAQLSANTDFQLRTGPSGFMADHQARAQSAPMWLMVDGRKLGEVVSAHQARAADRPQTGISGFDSRMMLTPAGGLIR